VLLGAGVAAGTAGGILLYKSRTVDVSVAIGPGAIGLGGRF
jgi:hypothetical protein